MAQLHDRGGVDFAQERAQRVEQAFFGRLRRRRHFEAHDRSARIGRNQIVNVPPTSTPTRHVIDRERPFDQIALREFACVAARNDPAGLQHERPRCHAQRFAHVLLDSSTVVPRAAICRMPA